ncbi:Rqc2 family fibronectin-binding protein [Clostridium felsineum]|uniref:Rqc2 family fibronectin-binding protein n=1 Tax=Clostridium felsineum TaxID=36839 RepID=UPI00098C3BFC|nr:NFACT RNA binding domain-containing protein [Clostridium felsineum]URZ00517.1 Rqc2 RqcH [Clostridium felsineum]URZ16402.1 Rqc2 RqcH [Clostridium felsineum DSM 794]
MALDGIYIHSILNELKSKLLGGKVSKVNQPEKDEINLTIRTTENSNLKLLISANPTYPKLHFTDLMKTNPIKAPMFCMVLRKHLLNSRILKIDQVESDRIVIMDFETTDELGFNSIYKLYIEIMGRHSNISLVREHDNLIMDCIKHITPEVNRYRTLLPGCKFVLPPKSTKLNPLSFEYEAFTNYIEENNIVQNQNMFSKIFTGVSSTFSKELYFNLEKYNSLKDFSLYLNDIFLKIKNNEFYFASYSTNNFVKDFYCLKLNYLEDFTEKKYETPSFLVQDFYYEKDKTERLKNRSSDLQKIVNTNLERCKKKNEIYEDELKECDSKDLYKVYGELLTSNIYNLKKGDKKADVLNYYSPNSETITIKLDENKTPSENIQRYFKKYNKLKKTEENAKIQIKNNTEEIEYLQSVLTNIENSDTYSEIEDIRQELMDTEYIRFSKKNKQKKKDKVSKPMHIKSKDGIDIYIGKNNKQNDYLTLKFADKRDIWFHTKNIPGSHVIVKNFGDIPESTLYEAASIAAYYSKARESSNVAVDYTEVKNVRKPSGAKPGMVIYYTNKTIYTNPTEPIIKKEGK